MDEITKETLEIEKLLFNKVMDDKVKIYAHLRLIRQLAEKPLVENPLIESITKFIKEKKSDDLYKCPPIEEQCREKHDGWHCNLLKGHTGPHKAYISTGILKHDWYNSTKTVKKQCHITSPQSIYWLCSLEEGHKGDHKAHVKSNVLNDLKYQWSNNEESIDGKCRQLKKGVGHCSLKLLHTGKHEAYVGHDLKGILLGSWY